VRPVGGADAHGLQFTVGTTNIAWNAGNAGSTATAEWGNQTGLRTDLSSATSATINQLRQSFQVQKLLERDAEEERAIPKSSARTSE